MPDDLDALLSEPLPGAAVPGEEDEELETEEDGDEFAMFANDVFDDALSPEERVDALRSAIMALTGPKLEM